MLLLHPLFAHAECAAAMYVEALLLRVRTKRFRWQERMSPAKRGEGASNSHVLYGDMNLQHITINGDQPDT